MSKQRKNYGLKSLDQKLTDILKPIFSGNKQEFLIINNLVKNWEKIVGEKYINFCYPKSVNFNKGKNISGENKQAKLTIIAHNSSIAFNLENNSEFILEKIATLYGYRAIHKIIIKQEPKQIENFDIKEEIKLSENDEQKLQKQIKDVSDKDLAETLANLGREILRK